jgi:hypothetical protein
MNLNIEGGARKPVHIITDADLAAGGYSLMGGAVIPVHGVTLADVEGYRGVDGGAAVAVYLVSTAQLALPRFQLQGGVRIPVCTAPADRSIESKVAIPIYDPDGAWEA